jgi:hypothetical protein
MDTQTLPATGTYAIVIDPSDVLTGAATLTLYDVPADVGQVLTSGVQAQAVTSVPGQNARFSFQGTAGQKISFAASSLTIPNYTPVTIYRPDGTYLTSMSVAQGDSLLVDVQSLPVTGTYTVLMDPQGVSTGSLRVTLYNTSDVKVAITPGGAPVTLTTLYPGQNARATFTATAGKRVSLRVSGVTIPGTYVTLNKPDGTSLAYVYTGSGGGFMDLQTLAVAGTYTILVDPSDIHTGSATLTLYNVPADASSSFVPGGAAVTVTTSVPGQNARLTFSGTAGQKVSLHFWGDTIPDYAYIALYSPSNVNLAALNVYQGGNGFWDAITLPTNGTYKILIDPQSANIGRLSVNNPPLATGTITPGGAAVSVNITSAGQNAKLTFNGTTGQRISLVVFNVTIPSSILRIIRPDGLDLSSVGVGTSGAFVDVQTLPVTGTYSILLDPYDTYIGRAAFALYNIVDVAGSITPGGSPVTVTTAAPGQRALLTFSGNGGQKVSLKLSNVTTTSVHVSLNKPDGTLTENWVGTSGGLLEAVTLPVGGTYTVLVDPEGAYTGSETLTLYDASDLTATIAPGGPPVKMTTTAPGQEARLTFAGTAGRKVSLIFSQVQSMSSINVYVYQPDGKLLTSTSVSTGPERILDGLTLALTGTYTILLHPQDANLSSVVVGMNEAGDVLGTITPGGPALTLATTAPGQNARATFTGTAGQRVSLRISGVTISGTNVTLNKPDGTQLSYLSVGTNGGFMDTQTLPATGTYAIVIDPSDVLTGAATLTLYDVPADVGQVLTSGVQAQAVTSVPGQNARFSFQGTAGQKVSLVASSISIPDYSYLAIYRPDGTQLTIVSVSQGGSNFIDTMTLPLTGTYIVRVDPQNANVGSAAVTLYNTPDVTGTITPGGAAVTVNIPTPGQDARLTFSGTAGMKLSFNLTSVTIPDSTYVTLHGPDGTQLAAANAYQSQNGFIDTLTLPLSGTYTIMINPTGTNTGSIVVKAVKH